jgi:hypothetical protein
VGLVTLPVVRRYVRLITLKIVSFTLDREFELKLISHLKWGKVG